MTNMLRNKLPRLALLLALTVSTASFDAKAAPAGDEAQAIAAAAMETAAADGAGELASVGMAEAAAPVADAGAGDVAAPAPREALASAVDYTLADGPAAKNAALDAIASQSTLAASLSATATNNSA